MLITIDMPAVLGGFFVIAFDIAIVCLALVLGAVAFRIALRVCPRFRKWFHNLTEEVCDE